MNDFEIQQEKEHYAEEQAFITGMFMAALGQDEQFDQLDKIRLDVSRQTFLQDYIDLSVRICRHWLCRSAVEDDEVEDVDLIFDYFTTDLLKATIDNNGFLPEWEEIVKMLDEAEKKAA